MADGATVLVGVGVLVLTRLTDGVGVGSSIRTCCVAVGDGADVSIWIGEDVGTGVLLGVQCCSEIFSTARMSVGVVWGDSPPVLANAMDATMMIAVTIAMPVINMTRRKHPTSPLRLGRANGWSGGAALPLVSDD